MYHFTLNIFIAFLTKLTSSVFTFCDVNTVTVAPYENYPMLISDDVTLG